ncbi:MAG: methyltransferase domain-containing protein [Dehalococcoidia bacterium]
MDLHQLLVCPACRAALRWSEMEARCDACPHAFPVVDGIPVLLIDQSAADHDELEHLHGHGHGHDHAHDHKQQQAAWFDREEAAEFEIARPHGAPALYRFLLGEKFRRSVAALAPILPGATALTVCGGSGLDAEYLARAGARVIASDISLGAARRVQERARRYRLPIVPLVADVERLPFADRAVDLVYVHDGLHHLERPAAGLAEMARVAARAVSVTEPAKAAATALAVRLGLALEREEAGNRVARLTPAQVAAFFQRSGFRPLRAERYAMYYRHEPGALFAALSRPALFPLTRSGWQIANRAVGRWGNKLTVQAVRP